MEIQTVTVSQEQSVTTGANYNFDKIKLFASVTASVGPEDSFEAVYAELAEKAKTALLANATRLGAEPSTAAAVQEARTVANTDTVPQVTAPKHQPTTTPGKAIKWSDAPTGSGNLTEGDLEVGTFPKKATMVAKVAQYWPHNGKGPSGGKTVLEGGTEIAHWDAAPEWSQGDTISITNAFQVKEYQGKLQLDLGKFCEVSVVGSAAPTAVEQWAE